MAWLFPLVSNKTFGDKFPKLSQGDLSGLPIKQITFKLPIKLREAKFQTTQDLYQIYLSNGNPNDLLLFVDDCLSSQSQETEIIFDLLGYLAKQMHETNKEKQKEEFRFLKWLESKLGIVINGVSGGGIEELAGKSAIKEFLGDYQKGHLPASLESIWDIFMRNRGRITNPLTASFQAEVREKYNDSLDLLLPMKKRLAHTDSIVDQIVYRLYDIPVEEVAIIESSF